MWPIAALNASAPPVIASSETQREWVIIVVSSTESASTPRKPTKVFIVALNSSVSTTFLISAMDPGLMGILVMRW